MTRAEFMEKLERELAARKVPEPEDILAEYRRHFEYKLADGCSEEETAARLGDPAELAAQFEPGEAQETRRAGSFGRSALTWTGLVRVSALNAFALGLLSGLLWLSGELALLRGPCGPYPGLSRPVPGPQPPPRGCMKYPHPGHHAPGWGYRPFSKQNAQAEAPVLLLVPAQGPVLPAECGNRAHAQAVAGAVRHRQVKSGMRLSTSQPQSSILSMRLYTSRRRLNNRKSSANRR